MVQLFEQFILCFLLRPLLCSVAISINPAVYTLEVYSLDLMLLVLDTYYNVEFWESKNFVLRVNFARFLLPRSDSNSHLYL